MYRYGQYCPISKALEQLGEKWTLLIIRELLQGRSRFNELQRALPKISPGLLAKRLKQLEAAGIVCRELALSGSHATYILTEAGKEAAPIIERLGIWGIRWADRHIAPDESDGYILMEDIRRNLDLKALQADRCAIRFDLRHENSVQAWWLLLDEDGADLCDTDPGHDIDVYVDSQLNALVDLWFGRQSFSALRRDNALRVSGKQALVRTFNRWLGRSSLASSR